MLLDLMYVVKPTGAKLHLYSPYKRKDDTVGRTLCGIDVFMRDERSKQGAMKIDGWPRCKRCFTKKGESV